MPPSLRSKQAPKLGVVNNKLEEVDDFDLELPHASKLIGSHINLIPVQSAVQGPRLFYGARFMNQAMPLQHPEEALVQNLDEESGRSFDDIMGQHAGAVFSDTDGDVEDVTKSHIVIRQPDGTKKMVELYENMPFNRSTAIHNSPSVAAGDKVKAGQLLARSNFTDHKGTLALGVNARVALVPFKGYSMDDAIVISEPFAKRLTSEHTETHTQDYDSDTRGGLHHFASLFPHEFTKDQLANIDENGIVRPGTVLHPGDPLMLATRPRTMTSSSAQLGKLSKAVSSTRSKAAQTWDYDEQGVVTDVAKTKTGYKVITQRYAPMKVGDKLVARAGQKGIVAKILPEAHMPRTADGQPMEVLLNQLGLPSRVNASTLYEVLLGKVAAKTGTPEKLPGFPKEKWHDIVRKKMADAGVRETEQLYDPLENKMLENEVTTGNAYILKLLHVVEKKSSARGTGSYDSWAQPSKGSGPNAQAKRLSGLDSAALMSSGAYKTLKEGATLRGSQCFDTQTEALTRRGWLRWADIQPEDELYTQDGNGRAFFEAPLKLHSYHYEGPMCGYEGKRLDFLVTPEHRLWMRHIKAPKLHFKTAKELHGRTFYIPQFGAVYSGTFSDDYTVVIPSETGWRSPALRLPVVEYCQLVGWWLAEGCSSVEDAGGRRGVTYIYQSQAANPAKCARIAAILDKLNLHYSVMKDTGGMARGFRIRNKPLAAHLLQYGTSAYDKKILPFIFETSVRCRQLLLDAYIDGDGHRPKGQVSGARASSVSQQLIDDFQRLAIQSGIGATVTTLKGGVSTATPVPVSDGHVIRQGVNPAWYIGFSFTGNNATVDGWHAADNYRHAYTEYYSGLVHCATMSTGLLYVRRNGKPMWSGNCDEYWRQVRSGNTPQAPGTPFAFSKFEALLNGSGLMAKNMGKGVLRLGPFTDKDLKSHKAIEIKHPGLVNAYTLEPEEGGLFDPGLVGAGKWGSIPLPHPLPLPPMEHSIRTLLGLTQQQLRDIIAGRAELPEHLR